MTQHEHHDTGPADPVRVSEGPADVERVHDPIADVDVDMDVAMVTTTGSSSSQGRLTSRPLSTQVAKADGDVLFLVRRSNPVSTLEALTGRKDVDGGSTVVELP